MVYLTIKDYMWRNNILTLEYRSNIIGNFSLCFRLPITAMDLTKLHVYWWTIKSFEWSDLIQQVATAPFHQPLSLQNHRVLKNLRVNPLYHQERIRQKAQWFNTKRYSFKIFEQSIIENKFFTCIQLLIETYI